MNIIERNNQRVLTSSQLGESYGTDIRTISNNYTRNKLRYEEGKHFFVLTGEELREFKTIHQIDDRLKHSSALYLWTAKGALLHAKSLGTDEAWTAYEQLVDDYFRKVEQIQQTKQDISHLSPQLQLLIMMEQKQQELEASQAELKESFTMLKVVVDNEVWITDHQKADIQSEVKQRLGHLKQQSIDAHFQGCYGDLNSFFGVPKYDKIKRGDFEQAVEFIRGWFPKKKETPSN